MSFIGVGRECDFLWESIASCDCLINSKEIVCTYKYIYSASKELSCKNINNDKKVLVRFEFKEKRCKSRIALWELSKKSF